MKAISSTRLQLFASGLILVFGSLASGQTTLPAGPGKETLERVCNACHKADVVVGRQGDVETWKKSIAAMVDRGAKASPAEFDEIANYLAANFPVRKVELKLPDAPGKEAFVKTCTKCHGPEKILGNEGTETHWNIVVDSMIRRGAKATDKEFDEIISYLSANFNYKAVPTNLPPGPGKEIAERACGACHGVEQFFGANKTKDGWDRTLDNMIGRGARVSKEEYEPLALYLTKFFGPSPNKLTDLNKAQPEEMVALLPITAEAADAMVHYREENGKFKSWDDFTQVLGQVSTTDVSKLDAYKARFSF